MRRLLGRDLCRRREVRLQRLLQLGVQRDVTFHDPQRIDPGFAFTFDQVEHVADSHIVSREVKRAVRAKLLSKRGDVLRAEGDI